MCCKHDGHCYDSLAIDVLRVLKCRIFLKIKQHQNEDKEQIQEINYFTLHCREQMLNCDCGVEPCGVPNYASFVHPNFTLKCTK